MNILIADDDGVSREILKEALATLGHTVVETKDGRSAAEALQQPGAPSLAILDWVMPGLDGPDVCKLIRRRPGRYTYIILLTARDGANDMVEALDSGADDFLTKPFKLGELRARIGAGERVLSLQDDLLRSQEVLRHEATHDRLTGLWNRGRILEELARELRRNLRELSRLSVILVDVDHFKQVNDSHGHSIGDQVLRHTAERILTALRSSDSVGRYGGEEFLVLLPKADLTGGRDVAERVRQLVANRPIIESPEVQVTISLGVACSDGIAVAEDMIQAADEALYRAKANGRNRVEVAEVLK